MTAIFPLKSRNALNELENIKMCLKINCSLMFYAEVEFESPPLTISGHPILSKRSSRQRDSLRLDREEEDDESYPSPPTATSSIKSPANNGGGASSPSDTDNKYDGAYYTNEPLHNRPAPVAFNRHALPLSPTLSFNGYL